MSESTDKATKGRLVAVLEVDQRRHSLPLMSVELQRKMDASEPAPHSIIARASIGPANIASPPWKYLKRRCVSAIVSLQPQPQPEPPTKEIATNENTNL